MLAAVRILIRVILTAKALSCFVDEPTDAHQLFTFITLKNKVSAMAAARFRGLVKPSIKIAPCLVSQQQRNSHIWYPDAKFERDFKVSYLIVEISLHNDFIMTDYWDVWIFIHA